jgi:hypothetical protein
MRILVTGSRDWTDGGVIATALSDAVNSDFFGSHLLIYGCARGADTIAFEIADAWDWEAEAHVANWEEYGRRAGPIRNSGMIEHGNPDICLAFPLPGSKGTWDMIRKANAAGIEVRIIPPTPDVPPL